MGIISVSDGTSDPIVTHLAAEDKMPWYKKPNLRTMYFFLFCCCMGIEITSGFDSQLINTLVGNLCLCPSDSTLTLSYSKFRQHSSSVCDNLSSLTYLGSMCKL
jgi:hypothetical protein